MEQPHTEQELSVMLKDAQELAMSVSVKKSGTRAHSIAVTHLETAQLWNAQDIKEKEEKIAKES